MKCERILFSPAHWVKHLFRVQEGKKGKAKVEQGSQFPPDTLGPDEVRPNVGKPSWPFR
jgi:hypothetical protein